MKNKVILKRIFHRGRWCIAIIFDYDETLREIVRSINGSAFSSTNRCFYVDDTEDNLKLVLQMLKNHADVDISLLASKHLTSYDTEVHAGLAGTSSAIKDQVPFHDESEDFNMQKTVTEIISNEEHNGINEDYYKRSEFDPVEFRTSEKEGLLVIKFLGRYDPLWIEEMKTYSDCFYDWKRKEWLLRWSKLTCDSLADYFAGKGIVVKVTRQAVGRELLSERKAVGDEVRSKGLGKEAADGLYSMQMFLDENRYSPKTCESYLAMLEFFFRYFSHKDPPEITEDEISRFIYDFVIRLGYSAAYQNQMVSAIKIYYSISGRGRVNPEFFERPRRTRALPKVLSKEEVTRILNSTRNIKHKLLLWIIYSCGLRRSEVINLKVTDLDRDRSILYIREGKGRVDRIVPISVKVWDKVDEYLGCCSPGDYLFEGQAGRRYSTESVYKVFKNALLKAGIRKDVGVHSLRHSYATHLHEGGLDIRYIQELLGHKSTRTTEIYTHVSRRNLVAVRSPIEDLDLK